MQEFDARIASLVAGEAGTSASEVADVLARARQCGRGTRGVHEPGRPEQGVEFRREESLRELVERVDGRFAGKLRLGSELAGSEVDGSVGCGAVCNDGVAPSQGTVRTLVRKAVRGPMPSLTRNQRRVLVRAKCREAEAAARRFIGAGDPDRGGVWSRTVYRQIRAGVQDASGRAAQCLLYILGTEEALRLAEELDARVPMDRRKIALAYAINSAPGSILGERVKLGFAMGLWSGVLADPNNPNLARRNRFRPSRRTLCSDLNWLEERKVLSRAQVPPHVAAPCEIKRGPYPTNRYFTRQSRSGGTLWAIAMALGDMPPAMRPNPGEEWSHEDAAALEEVRAVLRAELSAGEADARELPS